MIRSGEIFALLRNERDQVYYSSLIECIQDSSCSAFVGAGLSVHAGYPGSNELISYLIQEAQIEQADIDALTDFSVKATQIKRIIEEKGRDFYEILYRRFDEGHFAINRSVALIEDLVKIPFKSIVTTNYDSCIEEAADLQNLPFQEIQIFPNLVANNLEARKLYHIHGKIDHTKRADSSKTIVLTSEDYLRAYSEESPLPSVLNSILDTQHFLFIGFGLEEPTLEKLLELSKKRKRFVTDITGHPPRNPSYKYAILPIESKHLNREERTDEAIKGYLDSILNKDQELLDNYGIMVIRYYANSIHSQIKAIVRDIYTATKVSTTKVELDFTKTGVPG